VQRAGDAEATIDLATSLYSLLQFARQAAAAGARGQVRDAAAAALGDAWNHARFQAARTRIEQQEARGRLRERSRARRQLLQRARAAGEQAYPDADYDLAVACFLLARVLQTAGGSEQALPLLDEARQRFEAVAKERTQQSRGADGGEMLLGKRRLSSRSGSARRGRRRPTKSASAAESNSVTARGVAVGKGQLGTVRMQQRRYPEALKAFEEARERFTQLDEPGSVAVVWHQTGMVYQEAGRPEAAEDALPQIVSDQCATRKCRRTGEHAESVGNLYDLGFGRLEETANFFRQAADKVC